MKSQLFTNENSKFFQNFDRLFVVLFSFLFVVFVCYPLAQVASFDLRIADAFNTDEVEFIRPMLSAFHRGDFNIGRYDYGLFYYNIGMLLFYILDWFSPLTESTALISMRLLSSFFLLVNALVFRFIARNYFETSGSLTFILVLAGSITMVNYGVMVHPDLTQICMVGLAILFCGKYYTDYRLSQILIASVFAGLAFSTKFVGIAFLPILVVISVFRPIDFSRFLSTKLQNILLIILAGIVASLAQPSWIASYLSGDIELIQTVVILIEAIQYISIICVLGGILFLIVPKVGLLSISNFVRKVLVQSYLLGLAFLVGFAVGSPQAIRGFNFLNGLLYVAGLHKEGHWFKDNSGFLGWMQVLTEPNVVNLFFVILFVIGILYVFKEISANSTFQIGHPKLLPLWWIVVFCLVIVFRVKSHFAHYLIPIISFLLLYAAVGLDRLIRHFSNLIKLSSYASITIAVIVVLTGGMVLFNSSSYSSDRILIYKDSPELRSGNWLKENVLDTVSLSTDMYVYVPNQSNFSYRSYWGLSNDVLKNDNPDYLVINEHTYSWFLDANDVETYLHGREIFLERNKLYHDLIDDNHKDFRLVADFDKVKVYKKRPPNGDLK